MNNPFISYYYSGRSKRGTSRDSLIPPKLNDVQSFHLAMRGLNSIAGSLAVLTRMYHLDNLQCTSHPPGRVPFREIFHCRRRRWRYRCLRTSTRPNAQTHQYNYPRFTRGTRPGPSREHSAPFTPGQESKIILDLGERMPRGNPGESNRVHRT